MKRLILLLLLFSTIVFANIAKITTLNGEVDILRDNKTLKASKDFQILQKDIIKTMEDGRAQLLFTDNTIVSVGYNSTFSIDEYINDANKPPKVNFGLKKGFFKSMTGKIGKMNPDRFKLKTKSASIGIRGTTILIEVGENDEKVICTEGAIRVQNANGWSDVYQGEITRIQNGGMPTPAVKASQDDIDALEDQSGAKENEAESNIDQDTANSFNNRLNDTKENVVQNNQPAVIDTQDMGTGIDTGYENDLESSNIDQNIYYKSTLTNFYNQTTDKFSTRQRVITKDTKNTATSTIDGSYGDYLSWGHWGVTNDTSESKTDYSGTTYEGRSYWISGILTPASDVPQSGSATYTGNITGNIIRDANNASLVGANLSGTTSLTANFGSNSMSGTFNVDNFANTNLNNVTMTRENYGVTFSGSLSGTNVTSGQISGAFYGDNASAVGGLWTIENSSQSAADGTFAAQKQ